MFIRGDSWVERFVRIVDEADSMIAGDSGSDGDSDGVDMASMDRRWDVSIMWRLVP